MVKRVIAYIIVCIVLSYSLCGVYAADPSTLDRIDIKVVVHKDGSASITEIWNATVNGGSEASKALRHLNGSKVSNFKVTNESGKEYKLITPWDSDKTRIDKFTSYGIQDRMNGDVVLYWGLGDYGQRAYILNYDISKFVENCQDSQFMYFTFVSPNTMPSPQKIAIQMQFPSEIDIESVELFNYGMEFNQTLDTGTNSIKIESPDFKLTSQSYLVSLGKFNSNSFDSKASSNKTFENILAEANEGQGLGVVTQPMSLQDIAIKLLIIIALILGVLYILNTLKMIKRLKNESGLPVKFIFDKSAKGIPSLESVQYTDLLKTQSDNKLYDTYVLGLQYKMVQSTYSIIGAILIKWITEGIIKLNYDKERLDIFDIEFTTKEPDTKNVYETELYNMIKQASNNDKVTPKDLEKWFRENHDMISAWVDKIIVETCDNMYTNRECNILPMSSRVQKNMTFKEYATTEGLTERAWKIQGFKRYLKEFSKVQHSTMSNIDEYMVYAQLFNITNVFVEQIKLMSITEDCMFIREGSDGINRVIISINQLMSLAIMRLSSSKKSAHQEERKEAMKKKLGLK